MRGRNNKLAEQIGEHLVCAELGRRGFIATPFSGMFPLLTCWLQTNSAAPDHPPGYAPAVGPQCTRGSDGVPGWTP